MVGMNIAFQFEPRVYCGRLWEFACMNVITSTTKTVIRIPINIRGKHRDLMGRTGWRHNPRKIKRLSGFSGGMQIIQATLIWSGQKLLQIFVAVAVLVPLNACLSVISVRSDLYRRTWAMLVIRPDPLYQLFRFPVTV